MVTPTCNGAKTIELIYRRQTVPACSLHLPFLEHDQFNPGQRDLCGTKTLESQHRSVFAFDASMFLLHNVIEVFALPDLDTLIVVIIVGFDRRRVRTALIDIDDARFSIPFNRFGQKSQSRLLITLGRE